jgi:hypothetical protein
MNAFDNLYARVSSVYPKKVVAGYGELLITADLPINPRVYVGFSTLVSLAIAFVIGMAVLLLGLGLLLGLSSGVITFAIMMFALYYNLALTADARAAQIEKYLPEALQLISANIRAGMTIDRALWLCALPEFGPFEKELRKMAAETLGGKPIVQALNESSKRIKSVTLDRAYRLLVQGIQLGGALASLLTEIASDIRTSEGLKKEIDAATAMYTIFIIFASVLASPMLFAVSTFYVQATSKIWGAQAQETTQTASTGQASSQAQVFKVSPSESLTYQEVQLFSVVCLLITTFFGSLTIGLIKYGETKRGLKYVPLFVTGALAIYYIGFLIISSAFGQVMV